MGHSLWAGWKNFNQPLTVLSGSQSFLIQLPRKQLAPFSVVVVELSLGAVMTTDVYDSAIHTMFVVGVRQDGETGR